MKPLVANTNGDPERSQRYVARQRRFDREAVSRLKPNPRRALSAAKIAPAAVGRRSNKTASQQRRGQRASNRKSFPFSSEAFAGVRISYRHQKEALPEGEHDDIQLRGLLVALVSGCDGCVPGKKIAMGQEQ